MVEPRVALAAKNRLGECPRWDAGSQSLVWLDIPAQILHRYFPSAGRHSEIVLPERASAFAFHRGGGFVFAAANRIARADENGRIREILATADIPADARFNDGAVDAAGRFWVGTLNTAHRADNCLYRLDDGGLRVMDGGIGASNGIAWSADGRTMLLVDSPRKTIFAYDFDMAAGTIENRRVFAESGGEPGVPDGLTVDRDGGVWCAYWDGWRIVRYDETGRETARIAIPTPRPTACAFGGENLSLLFVTSSSDGIDTDDVGLAGAVFVLEMEIPGTLPFAAL